MFAQLFDSFRRASEATLQAQQDVFRQWVQQWPAVPGNSHGSAGEWSEAMQKRWMDSTKDFFNKQRELLDSTYRSGVDVIEQGFRVTDAKSPEEYRRLMEEMWGKLSDTFKQQSESQFREFQKAAERWFELARSGSVMPADAMREGRDRDSERGYPEPNAARA